VLARGGDDVAFAGEADDGLVMLPLAQLASLVDESQRRPLHQWWHALRATSAKINERRFADTPLGTAPGERAARTSERRKFRG